MSKWRHWGVLRWHVWGTGLLVGLLLGGAPPHPRPMDQRAAPPESRPEKRASEVRPRRLVAGEAHTYRFDLEPGEFVAIEVEQQRFDIVARVWGPAGETLFGVDSLNGLLGPEQVPLLARTRGRYTVEITGNGPGRYRIHSQAKRRASAPDRLNNEGAVEYWRGLELKKGDASARRRAESAFAAALAAWTKSGFRAGQADASYRLGRLRLDRKDWRGVVAPMRRATDLFRDLANRRQTALALNGLGLTHQALAEPEKALAFFDRALALAATLGDEQLTADLLYNRGRANTETGRYEAAMNDIETALEIRRRRKAPLEIAQAVNALGRLYSSLEDTGTAIRLHRDALEILVRHPSDEIKAEAWTHLGDAFRKRNEVERAVGLYRSAIALTQRAGIPDDPNTLNNLAVAYVQMEKFPEAAGAARRCVHEFQAQGNLASAAAAWATLGWALSGMERFEQAFEAFGQSLSVARAKHLPIMTGAYLGMAWAEVKRGNPIAARRFAEKGLKLVEELRIGTQRPKLRTTYLAGRQDFYDLLVEILMEQDRREPAKGYDLKAFEASEQARSRSLLDELEGRPVIPALTVRDIQRQVLGADDVLLEYFVGRERSFLWILTPSTFATRELSAPSHIIALAREVHLLLGTSHRIERRGIAIERATALSRALFGTVGNDLAGKRILIVAPPALQYISFAALPADTPTARPAGTSWPEPWIKRNEIIAEPSATFLATLRRSLATRRPASGLIALVADPVYTRQDERARGLPAAAPGARLSSLSKLLFSQHEIDAIAVQAKGGRLLPALGFRATRQRVLSGELADYRYLHFSAHGALNVEEPDRSALVLSLLDRAGRDVDGYLRAGEIARLQLAADLVVLSACKSGLGSEIRGEGLVGLTQAFFAAGASRTMASLWDVDAQATAKLMGRFYRNLLHQGLSPSASLREAQEWMWEQPQWNAPSYWAGFVLEGDLR